MASRPSESLGAETAVEARKRPRQPRVSVVVPALNEARNLREVLQALPDVHEVILVDGGSVDGTVQAAREARPDIVVVTQVRRGKGNALAAGFARVTGDVVVMFDADGSADPGEIPRFVEALVEGADFAKGSRFRRTRFTNLSYGYNAFWADLLPLLDLPDHDLVAPDGSPMLWGDGFEIEALISCRLASAGVAVAEVPGVERQRIHGRSTRHAVTDGVRVLRTLRIERTRLRRTRALDRALLGQSRAAR